MKFYKYLVIGLLVPALYGLLILGGQTHSASASPAVNATQILLSGAPILHASAAVADFNGDGYLEIVVGTSDGTLHVLAYNSATSTWSSVWSRQTALDINAASPPHPKSSNKIESAPIIANLDSDSNLEIVVTTGGLPADEFNGGLLVYQYQSDSPWNFTIDGDWPQPKLDIVGGGSGASNPDGYWDGIYPSPAVGDLDGDGDLEIVFEGEDRRIHAYQHDGTVVPGWPFSRDAGDPILRGGLSSPALGDIDGDGLPEIIVGGNSPQWAGEGTDADYTKAAVWALNGDSTIVPGWPQYAGDWVDSSPALGDIDNDGELEVIVGTGRDGINRGDTGGYYVYAWNADGTAVPGWPRPTGANMGSSPALADLDEDGSLDVIIGCGAEEASNCHNLYAWHGDGSNVSGFPMQPLDVNPWGHDPQRLPFLPIVADIDGDNHLEILLTMANSNGVSVVNHDGTKSTDYSRIQNDYTIGMLASPVVADVDNDGLLETIGTGSGTDGSTTQAAVYIWDEVASASAKQPWPMFHHDGNRTGLVPLDETPPTNPTSLQATPPENYWTNDNTIQVTWSGAADDSSGVARYYYAWDTTADTSLTDQNAYVISPTHSLTSPPLSDSSDWYFHLRTADRLGNVATDTLHLGPFKIDTQPPASQASSPLTSTGDIPVSWGGTDGGSGIIFYTIQVRRGITGTWQNWLTNITAGTQTDTYTATSCGYTYYFRSQATDAAGNQERLTNESDTATLETTPHSLRGLIINNRGEPIWGARVDSAGACVSADSDAGGQFTIYYPAAGVYDLAASHRDFGTPAPMHGLSTTAPLTVTFVMPPLNDSVQNGDFESDLSGWQAEGSVQVASYSHTGDHSVAFTGSGSLVQTTTVPENGTLSWMHELSPAATTAPQITAAYLQVSSAQSGTISTTLHLRSRWTHQLLDVSSLSGTQVTITVQAEGSGSNVLYLDEFSLGPTAPGKATVYLPLVLRQ